MAQLTKLQIETAESLLKKTLNKKKKEIADAEFKKDVAKFKPALIAINKKAMKLREELVDLKKIVERNPKLKFELDDSYGNYAGRLPKTLEDAEENETMIKARGGNYPDYRGKYDPDMKAEEEAVAKFVLELILGTALMSDLQTLIDRINHKK